MKRLLTITLLIVFVLLGTTYGMSNAARADGGARAPERAPGGPATTIASIIGNPLHIHVGSDGSAQVDYQYSPPLSPDGQFYEPSHMTADQGIFVWHGTAVHGPHLGEPGRISRYTNPPIPFVEISQVGPTGTGTPSNPFHVTTTLGISNSNITIQHVHTYVNGQQHFTMTSTIQSTNEVPETVTYFNAGDISHRPNDIGHGVFQQCPTGKVVGGATPNNDFYTLFGPISPAPTHHEENVFSTIWDHIGRNAVPGPGLNNTINPANVDHGAGLEWQNLTVPAGGTVVVSHWLSFGPTPVIPIACQEEPTPTPTPNPQPPPPPGQVPEGDTLVLVGTGLAGLAGYARLRWRARQKSK